MGKEGASRSKGSPIGGKAGGGGFSKKNDGGHAKPAYKPHKPFSAGGSAQKKINRDGGVKSMDAGDGSFDRRRDFTPEVESDRTNRRRGCFLTGCALPMTLAVAAAVVLAVVLAF